MTKIHPDPALSGGENGLNKVREFIAASSTQGGGWDDSWKGGATPWDAGSPQPALTSTLQDPETSKLIPTKGRGLVAGCGRGYDVLCLADRGLEVVGADISETAVQKAREWLETQPPSDARSRSSFSVIDFFALGTEEGNKELAGDGFDLAYDYTFFCAIPPSLHKKWAESYARNIKKGGILFATVYPIHGPREGGPPFSVHPDIYSSLLSETFELLHHAVPKEQKETHVGVEEVMIWRKK